MSSCAVVLFHIRLSTRNTIQNTVQALVFVFSSISAKRAAVINNYSC